MNRGLQNNSFDTGFTTTLLKLLKKVVVPAAHIILTYTTTENFLLKSQRAGTSVSFLQLNVSRNLLVVGYIKTARKSGDS